MLTRFNLATRGAKQTRIRLQPGWLDDRFELFERYCAPTMAAQTVGDVTWLVYFDEETPQPHRDRIERIRREVVDFVPVFTGLFEADGWLRTIHEHVEPAEYLLTSRLDNDDGLAVDAVERLQAAVRPARVALNFPEGFVLSGHKAYRHRHEANAFVSLLAPWDDGATVHDANHLDVGTLAPVEQLPGPGAWLQVVHGDNVSNKVRGTRVPPRELATRFPDVALADLEPASPATITLENAVATPLRSLRDKAVAAVRGRG